MPLSDQLLVWLALLAALGCGVIAGVFFAFSTFVMKALARIPHPQGMAAMQSINVAVLNPLFLGVFMGTAVICIAILVLAPMRWQESGAPCLVAGALLYVVGTVLVTMLFNVPRNNALASLSATDPTSAQRWMSYASSWTAWNHVRTAAALAAAVCFCTGLAS